VHRDEVHRVLTGRRGTRMLALTSGGAIPEVADYRVVLEPEETFIGTLNEDFAIESNAGDVFQLGNASWRITQVLPGVVRVTDAQGAPPSLPFWFGEAPARSDELSRAVSDLRADLDRELDGADPHGWLEGETGVCPAAAEQLVDYLKAGRATLGVVPTQDTLVLERFFDESGGMQLVLHAPFGSRINRAWALALRKRFCRQFNFELQAAATDDALLLSLGPQHSFPLADVFRYLHSATARDILVQAFLDAPVFKTRWRWNATISLAVPRSRGGRKVPPQLQRMQADDLMAAAFPDAAACLENIPGDREIPDHPLVNQTVRDCLEEAMDFHGLSVVLDRIHRGELQCVARDTPEPSAFAHEVLNARPYAFLDDAPLEERRTQAVQTRRATDLAAGDVGALDAAAIERVRDEARPDPRNADELHDVLVTNGFLLDSELDPAAVTTSVAAAMFDELMVERRATRVRVAGGGRHVWVAAERLPELLAVHPAATLDPVIAAPSTRAGQIWTREAALAELMRGRLAVTGPTTARALADSLAVAEPDAEGALLALESDGAVLRGVFTPGTRVLEWCDRRLLARIHRDTLNRLRAEIAPTSAADFMRFLFAWQHVAPASQCTGIDGLRAVLAQLDGVELPARAWEGDVLPARLDRYDPSMLDLLCLTGDVAWARLSSGPTQVVGATPIALFLREDADAWMALREPREPTLRPETVPVIERLRSHGASFGHELMAACDLSDDSFRAAIGELVSAGLAASDGFAGLRAIIGTGRAPAPVRLNRTNSAGRWSARGGGNITVRVEAIERLAWALLHRYGVVFRRMLTREPAEVPWRELARVYRRLEARGEIRGGRFVSGMPGEQFALADAVERLREVRREPADHRLITISAADPLNLTGIVTPGDRLRAVTANRIVYRDGVPLAAMEGDMLRTLAPVDPSISADVAAAAAGRRVPVISGYVGRR
jgi:ATP-dependent Lhr-like helicase